VGRLIARVLNNAKSQQAIDEVRCGVAALTDKHPLYAWRRAPAPAMAG
jgi:glycine/serine hydroxymethyltransferase